MDKLLFYIDDDSDDLAIFLYAAKSLQVNIQLFATGEHFLNQLEISDDRPTAIFIDINMPRMNGFEVIQKIGGHQKLDHVPLIAFSTASDPTSIQRAADAGATCFISKPASIAQLKKIVNMVITTDWTRYDRNQNFYFKNF